VALNAQVQALEFYRAEGFVPEGPVFEEAGIDHQAMRMTLG
jgi:predicted GNAT family N-acyltransferase